MSDFPGADMVLPRLDVDAAGLGADSWAVVATMGHYDEDGLAALLAHQQVDVALVASERRGAAVLANLLQRGLDEPTLQRVRIPAGGRRSGRQEQIALFALVEIAELRAERQRRTGATPFLSTEDRPSDAGARLPDARFATDPVCGMVVDVAESAHVLDHDGVVVHFCSAGCAQRFRADPAAFVASLSG